MNEDSELETLHIYATALAHVVVNDFLNACTDTWQSVEKEILDSSIRGEVQARFPKLQPDQSKMVTDLAIELLVKMRSDQRPAESPRKPEDHPFSAPHPDEFWPT
jgi:hypothetical protein